MKNQGFALLEILVVVLMLGILVAIAIPQYQMAVLKAKASQVVSLVRSLSQDQEFFYFEHRRYAKKFSDLNVQIPANNKSCVYWPKSRIVQADCHNLGNGWEIGFFIQPGTDRPASIEAHYQENLSITYYLRNERGNNSTRKRAGDSLVCHQIVGENV